MRGWTIEKGDEPHAWHVVDPSGHVRVRNESYTVAANIEAACNAGGGVGGECGEVAQALLAK